MNDDTSCRTIFIFSSESNSFNIFKILFELDNIESYQIYVELIIFLVKKDQLLDNGR
jgi:hypothetical protein